jgi:TPR repeat protein
MNNKKLKIFTLSMAALALCSCAGLNPNIGTRTADDAYKRGDCTAAMNIYERSAENGQPWAQTRLGIAYYEGKCRSIDYAQSKTWLERAATYEAQTDWERGKEFSTGPVGFFNTRTSSSNASILLARMYMQGAGVKRDLVTGWLWANHAVKMSYDEDKSHREAARTLIEREMSFAELQRAKDLAQSWPPKN